MFMRFRANYNDTEGGDFEYTYKLSNKNRNILPQEQNIWIF